jgi:hypothetical protein
VSAIARIVIAVVMLIGLAGPIQAQRLSSPLPEFQAAPLDLQATAVVPLWFGPGPSRRSQEVLAFGNPKDHRWEGLLVGAVTLGLLSGVTVVYWCNHADTHYSCVYPTIAATVGGATLGAVIGGFIGTAMPKHDTSN